MTLPIGDALRQEAAMQEALAVHPQIGDRIWAAVEDFLGEPLDDRLRQRMQEAASETFENEIAKLPELLRPMFTEPEVRIEHGEGSRLPPTNVYMDFPDPVNALFRPLRITRYA
ncbi:hypothetical protein H9Q09_00795 [Aurantimonas sp. DM33-3]|uniref:hypothetical protein n=1 Tax=Aurantimonas sp. DM33-3 TaxID=2766955 RepID=UPI001652935B|nr:hypothetical protein [Aurantimonas sp. DM33-3]MBC6714721.1 hypothetical protein [Aurantimonas sp. DM33-3]